MFTTIQNTIQNTLITIPKTIQETIQETIQNFTSNNTIDDISEITPLLPPPPSSSQDEIQNHIRNQNKKTLGTIFPKVLTNQLYLDIRQKIYLKHLI